MKQYQVTLIHDENWYTIGHVYATSYAAALAISVENEMR